MRLNFLSNGKFPLMTLSAQYFLFFGVMGVFLPYFNLYCYHLKFTSFQIGLLSGVRTLATLIFPLVFSRFADHFQLRKPIYIGLNFLSTFVWGFYLLFNDFWQMFVITLVYATFYSPIISFLETFTIDFLGSEKNRYGQIRAWGSIHFIIIALILGRIIDMYHVDLILILILFGSLIQAILSFYVPSRPFSDQHARKKKRLNFFGLQTNIFLFSAFLMLLSHGTYYGFFSIHLAQLGYGNTFIGINWALASIFEILIMLRSQFIFKRFSFETVFIATFFIACLRWVLLFFAVSPVAILISQVLHAFTYGAFHMASILFIDKLTPMDNKTFGQAVNNAVTYGLGMTLGFVLNGYYYDRYGVYMFLVSASIALLGGGLMLAYKYQQT